MKKITVAITVRGNDSKLLSTIESAKEQTKGLDAEIMVVSDGPVGVSNLPNDIVLVLTGEKPMGTSYAKHVAMRNAEHDKVVCCDSHMEFPKGCFEMYYDHLEKFPKHILCSVCEMIGLDGTSSPYYGGGFKCKIVGDPRNTTARQKGERQPFGIQWRSEKQPGPLQGVMGGCYGLTKTFYDTMDQPWQYGKGWGADEESISLAGWYMGGLCWLLPQTVNHFCGIRGFVEDNYFQSAPLYNRRRVVEMIDDKVTRNEFIRWFNEAHAFVYDDLKDFSPITAWRNEITNKKERYFVDLIDDWESEITIKDLYYVQEELGVDVKQNQNRDEMMKLWRSSVVKPNEEIEIVAIEDESSIENPVIRGKANYGATENRRVCHKCGSSASKVNSTKKTGRTIIRYRECLKCQALRCTQEITE